MTVWTIEPNHGLGPLRFGMTPAQVLAADPSLGPPDRSKQQFDGSVSEFRALGVPQLGYRDGMLADIDTSWRTPDVRFLGIDVYRTEPEQVIRRFMEYDPGLLLDEGSLVFLKLGINTGGFFLAESGTFKRLDDGEDEYRTLAVFRPGLFDDLLEGARPFAPR